VSTDGAQWSQPRRIPGIKSGVQRPYDVYDMVTDSAGHVHLVVVGYALESDAMALLHSEWNGHTWSPPDVIASGAPYPEYPRLAVGEGNRLHVVWFGGDKLTIDRSPVGIWYSTAPTAAPKQLGLLGAAPKTASPPEAERRLQVPTQSTLAVPTPVELPEASRLYYDGGRSTDFGSFSKHPAVPIFAAIVAAFTVLGIVLSVQRGVFSPLVNRMKDQR
jgi:hypothetical protein